jgi:hypothetical protein
MTATAAADAASASAWFFLLLLCRGAHNFDTADLGTGTDGIPIVITEFFAKRFTVGKCDEEILLNVSNFCFLKLLKSKICN